MILINLAQVLMALAITSSKNPVKASLIIMLMSITFMVEMWESTSVTWVPLVMTLLFTGGILVMFMILSSFQPNESPTKMKVIQVAAMSVCLIWGSSMLEGSLNSHSTIEETALKIKIFFQETSSVSTMFLIIILYFWIFIKILKKEQNSMRSLIC